MTRTGLALLAAAVLGALGFAGYSLRGCYGPPRAVSPVSVPPETTLLIPALVLVVLLILVLAGLIVMVFRAARRDAAEPEAAPAPAPPSEPATPGTASAPIPERRTRYSAGALKAGFVRAERWLRERVAGPDYRYRIPWIPFIGPSGAGKTHGLARCGLHMPDGPPFAGEETARNPLNWWFFERGAALDLAGDLAVRHDRPESDPDPADLRLWNRFLRLLQRHRPKKPTDGVVLALPCPDLLAAEKNGGGNLLVQTAEALYRRLWRLQQITGIRFPVYLLITRCETLEGFSEFRRELPETLTGQMFGWSTDQPPGAAVTGDWVRDAFAAVSRNLDRIQFELLTEGVRPEHRDGVFQFPQSLGRLESPLRTAVDRIFRQSAYHESFVLRGIYFSGGDGHFLRDLLDRKVFPEAGLARPLQGARLSRNRRLLAVQAAAALLALVLGGGLWWDARRLRSDVRQTTPTIAQINTDVRDMKAKGLEGLTGIAFFNILRTEKHFFRESVINLIRGLADVRSLRYPFLPASWYSPIHDQIRRAMTLAYDEIVLKGVYVFLVQRTESLFQELQTAVRAAPPPSGEVIRVDEAPEFEALRQFADAIRRHEGHVEEYNDLRDTQSMEGLARIIEYLFDLRLPEGFYQGDQYYYRALEETRYREFDIRAYRMKARQVRVDGFIERMFIHNPVRRVIAELEKKLQAFDTRERAEPGLPDIQALLERIASAQDVIRRSELAWVFREPLDLGNGFNQLLYDIENLHFFGGDLRDRVEGELAAAFRRLREDLRLRATGLTGPLLQRADGGNELLPALSEPTLALQAEMEKLAEQAFMARAEGQSLELMLPPGMQIQWETVPLQEAVDLLAPYRRFARVDLEAFPAQLRSTVGNVAQSNLERQLLDRIRRAMRFEPLSLDRAGRLRERDLAEEVDAFRAASPHLTRILTSAERLNLRDVYAVLREVGASQVARLLTTVDDLLAAADLYEARGGDFSWWDGQGPVSFDAFGAADETELDHYLRVQRERVRHLAFAYAEPLVAFSAGTGVSRDRPESDLLFKWERILTALEAYQNRDPDNPAAQLESFIRFGMDEITPTAYFRTVQPAELNERSGNFFLARRNRLRRRLYERCRALSYVHVQEGWDVLRDRFNRLLAGRYPFVAQSDPAREVGVEAEPEALREFFETFQAEADDLKALLAAAPGAPVGDREGERAVMDFLTRMTEVEAFFGPFLDPPPAGPVGGNGAAAENGEEAPSAAAEELPDVPAFDLTASFRVNRDREVLANRIIDWTFGAGGQVVRYGGDARGARWIYGEPVRLRLRWARNGLDVPVYAPPPAAVNQEARAVTFEYDNRWALIRMLQAHRADSADVPAGRDPRPHTLRFRVDTERVGSETVEALPGTRVYLRLELATPGRAGRSVALPDFPAAAPSLAPVPEPEEIANEF
ncbi:MAG: type VI secretion system protein [Desulfococcaceae bacterium]